MNFEGKAWFEAEGEGEGGQEVLSAPELYFNLQMIYY